MGYTHYFSLKDADSPEWKAAWPKLVEGAQIIVDSFAGSWTEIVGPEGEEDDPYTIDVKDGIQLNGLLDDCHEPLRIYPDGVSWGFCKTARKPYDLVVCCILLRAHALAPENFLVSSDGDWENEWVETRDLYESLWPDEDEPDCPWCVYVTETSEKKKREKSDRK